MEKRMESKKTSAPKRPYWAYIGVFLTVSVIIATIVYSFAFFDLQGQRGEAAKDVQTQYEKHIALITDKSSELFWQSVYKGLVEEGKKGNYAYIEYFGRNLSREYSTAELMRMAIDSRVDGIIVQADESDRMTTLIDEAIEGGIAVATLQSDDPVSLRQFYIGINNFNIGQIYGDQVIKLLDKLVADSGGENSESMVEGNKVFVLMDMGGDTAKNITFQAMKDVFANHNTYAVNVEAVSIDSSMLFSPEETIRDLVVNETGAPIVIVCLNAVNTRSAYQAVVDHNKVGKIGIIGYYDSGNPAVEDENAAPEGSSAQSYDASIILGGIEKDIIFSAVMVDGEQMGKTCVKMLKEYFRTGYVSAYSPVDTMLIDASNVREILQ